ncbi:hypothetical protein FHW89_004230 [Mucilaginibacter sp. SG564]|nr:hypothetical protein [Mucilaginibacter sp. SG564]
MTLFKKINKIKRQLNQKITNQLFTLNNSMMEEIQKIS